MGNTLLELIVTLAIMGIVTAITLPAFAVAATAHDADPSRTLAMILRAARLRALTTGSIVTVTVDPVTGGYWVVSGDDSTVAAGDLAITANTTISAIAPRLTLAFSTTGAAAGDSVTIVSPTSVTTLGADPWTGEVYAHAR